MSFYDDASLIMFPSGYKEDKIYSLKPTDGSGDLTFTRASTATRVNSDGLIETSPVNLVEYSEEFDNAFWGVSNGTITSNTTTAPNGTTTADTFTRTSSTAYLFNGSFNLVIGQFTQSVYAKANAISSIRLELVTSGFSRGAACIFDLSNGTAGTLTIYGGVSGFTATIESVGDGWYRCSIGGTITIADTYFWELSITSGSVYIWGAQLNIGATAKPYFPTTDRLNVPRIDYTGGGCAKLLLESQRTNLVTYSEQFDNAAWTKNVTVSANSTISPDGTQNADKILESASNVQQWAYQSFSMTGAQTATIYAKKGERNYIALATAGLDFSYFNLDTGVVVSTASGATTSIQNAGNGWYRCSVNASTPTSTFFIVAISDNGTRIDYAGDVTKGIYVWAGQNESGSYATSYIPTLASSVTRLADAASKTGISSLIGQTEGTLFADLYINNAIGNSGILGVFGTGVTFIYIFYSSAITASVFDNGAIQAQLQHTISTAGRYKIAIGYKANDFVLYVNGVQRASDTSGTVPACSDLSIQSPTYGLFENTNNSQLALYKTRLTNAELATLTTL